ncbi:MAG TPA: POTRA domain-containing protein [Candidatus Acidoferrales bacterium]|nr:POTRA domain-containing protein [Candidatus Acidoferrales bacterium]
MLGLLAFGSIAAPAQQPAAEQQPASSGTLVAVTATGSRKFTSDQILSVAGLRVGQAVTREEFQAAADRLAATGLFSGVHYRFSSQGANITLEFQVADAAAVPVGFDNFPWFTDDQLASELSRALGLYDGTAPAQGGYVDRIGARLEILLAAQGVPGKVEHRLIQRPDGDGMEQQFRVVGPDLKVVSVAFSDPIAAQDAGIQQRLADLLGKPYSRYALTVFLVEQVRPPFLTQGFLRVRFGAPRVRFVSASGKPDASQVQIEVPVTRGSRYAWAGATWVGNTVFTAAALDRLADLRAGQVADGMAIQAAWGHVRQEYGSQGYLDAAVDPQPSFDDAKGTVSYQVKIDEGAQYKMGKLVISGLSVEAEARIRENWLIHPGQTFDLDYFHAFLDEQVKKALADLPVHYDHVGRYLQHNAEDHTVDVMLDFQ